MIEILAFAIIIPARLKVARLGSDQHKVTIDNQPLQDAYSTMPKDEEKIATNTAVAASLTPGLSPVTSEPLQRATSADWVDVVLQDFDTFLLDHAAAEKKAAGMALSMISHYPDRRALVDAMSELAVEELSHFKEVIRWIHRRGLQLGPDKKDPYIHAMRDQIRQGKDAYFLDRLITSGIIEARGCERFFLIAEALTEKPLKNFYRAIASSEQRHYEQLLSLAKLYFEDDVVEARANELLKIEADIVATMPIRAALH